MFKIVKKKKIDRKKSSKESIILPVNVVFFLYRSIESNIYNLAYFWKMPVFFI